MLGAIAVKHMAMEANINPPKKAKRGTNMKKGVETKPKAATTTNAVEELMVARVAPHRSSPAITSSTLTGVAIIASKVFWKYIRTKEPYVHSKNEPYIIEMETKEGAMNCM